MFSIPNTYAEIITGFDLIMLIIALLLRKPKNKSRISTLDHKLTVLMGYYLMGSAVGILIISHLVISFHNYICYYMGLSLDTFMFYLGMVIRHV